MILYFTGTGNSQYAAEYLSAILKKDIVSMNECMKKGEYPTFQTEESYIFVLPTYAWRIPRVCENFIKQSAFCGAKDVWFVLTCGDSIGNAGDYARKLCEEKGLNYRGMADVVMPENYITMFKAPTKEEEPLIMETARRRLHSIAEIILRNHDLTQKCAKSRLLSTVVNPVFYKVFVKDQAFYAKETCTGCGFCREICPLQNIRMEKGKPVWQGDCTQCMACICGCPAEAIEYGKKTVGKRRYWCEPFDKPL